MSKIDFPHIYKKGKTIKLKNLDENTEKKEYIFSTPPKTGVQAIANHCNNINQIVARCFLNTLKINHYFGISKDISENLSKNKLPFNQFKEDLNHTLKKGGNTDKFEKLFEIINNQNKLITKLNQSIDNHSNYLERITKNNQFVEEVAKKANIEGVLKEHSLKLADIQNLLKQLIG